MADDRYELSLTRLIDAPAEALWRCWTEPDLIKQWFTPRPWTTPVVEVDVRPGGSSYMLFQGPNGEEFPNRGVYLEVERNRRLVFTDAYVEAWVPSAKPFLTAIISFTPEGGGTRYSARVLHWTAEDMRRHEEMGFHDGWGKATDQLEAVARAL
jgi:uncharacterized protein YndB with AHSA1/START domain